MNNKSRELDYGSFYYFASIKEKQTKFIYEISLEKKTTSRKVELHFILLCKVILKLLQNWTLIFT